MGRTGRRALALSGRSIVDGSGRRVAGAATTTATAAAAVAGSQGGSITISETSNPDFLDPALAYTVEASEPHWIIYTGLMAYKHAEGKEGAELIPGAADAEPEVSADGKTYKFTLRKGLKYSDGTPAKASDFEHTIQRVADPRVGRPELLRGHPGCGQVREGQEGRRGHLGHHVQQRHR